eukprot:756399-Hanusia_phi.AAC.5
MSCSFRYQQVCSLLNIPDSPNFLDISLTLLLLHRAFIVCISEKIEKRSGQVIVTESRTLHSKHFLRAQHINQP